MVPVVTFVVIVIFSIVQSIFGVGLLVFGTPTLLLIGYSFPDTLAILLPASLAVSLLQLWSNAPPDRQFIARFAIWCLVPVVAMLALVLTIHLQASLNLFVAAILAVFAALRTIPSFDEAARHLVRKNERIWLLLMGTIHGLSNLGGGLLTVLAAAQSHDKGAIRHLIAVCYSCFAAIQLAVLGALSPGVFRPGQLAYAGTAAVVFLLVGQHVFRWVSAPVFHHLFTGLMVAYAALLGLRAAGLI